MLIEHVLDGEGSPKQPQIVITEESGEVNLGSDSEMALHRVNASDAQWQAPEQDENEPPHTSIAPTGPKQRKSEKQKRRRSYAEYPEDAILPDLSLVRTPATNQLPQPPSEEEQKAIAYEKLIKEEFRGVEPWVWRKRHLAPTYAEDYGEFKDRKFGEPNPSVSIRVKRLVARAVTAIANPISSATRCLCCFPKLCFKFYCVCLHHELDTPKIWIKRPSNEDGGNKFGRASISHATPKGSIEKTKKNYSHLPTAHKINQSRHLLQPPKPMYGRDCEDIEDPHEDVGQQPSASTHVSAGRDDKVVICQRRWDCKGRKGFIDQRRAAPSAATKTKDGAIVTESECDDRTNDGGQNE